MIPEEVDASAEDRAVGWLERASAALRPSSALSERGFDEAEEQVRLFVDDLADEAGRIARRVGSEEASAKHVRRAAEAIYSSSRQRRSDMLIAVGGVVSGAGISAAVSAALADPLASWALAISVAASIVGSVTLTWGLVGK